MTTTPIVHLVNTQDLVTEFHRVFGCAVHDQLGLTNTDLVNCRITLIREETGEVIEALNQRDLAAVAKELADLAYVTYGTAVALGIDLDAAVRAVHESNMTKLEDDGQPIIRADGKVLKGPRYREPDMSAALFG